MLFTTSWDDGYASDLRIAGVLEKHGSTGTFYICPTDPEPKNLLTTDQVKKISERHEIGAHTINHPHLPRLSLAEAKYEIEESKKVVEEMTGKPCTSFCYPYGDFNPAITSLVRGAGFSCARSTSGLHFSPLHPFALPVTLQVYPFPWRPKYSRWWHCFDPLGPMRAKFRKLSKIGIPVTKMGSWLSLAIALFDKALEKNSPFFHLWGHGHELDAYHQWDDLDRFLAHVEKSGVKSVTNTELMTLLA